MAVVRKSDKLALTDENFSHIFNIMSGETGSFLTTGPKAGITLNL